MSDVVFTELVRACVRSGEVASAHRIYSEAQQRDEAPVLDDGMCNQLVVACAAGGLLREALSMYRQMRLQV
jgi:pentatricopeptide repeat protein